MKNLIIWAVILGTVGYGGSKLLLHHKVGEGVDQAVMVVSPFVNIEYKGVSSTEVVPFVWTAKPDSISGSEPVV